MKSSVILALPHAIMLLIAVGGLIKALVGSSVWKICFTGRMAG